MFNMAFYNQYPVEDIIIQSQPPKLQANTWSQQFVSFLELCLKKDPAERWSAEILLQPPFITGLPPKTIIRAEIQQHLQAQQKRPAKRGSIVSRVKGAALWAREQLRRTCYFCAHKTLAEEKAAQQMALKGFPCY
ncbi:serine/threonine-protein kinase 3-like isoform X2 [Xenopus tropicalis]|uniref:Serine/threonine-protein kinase 3-like isoform X2 n=1 Tax=Xenopus tropicalis TaxID=8364 RepID=A0A8J0SPJ2_XENTR|nr:serine/threonine-protein kinase 3-like isoform X2 [Xenopus tropicalis]|eukprot:XP_012826924.1 PREDICTED: serine/threonine-protein kinase 3-like isoform X2 [Xenopus tropicalis]